MDLEGFVEVEHMRILLISQSYPPMKSARALQIGKVVNALQLADCEITVIAGNINNHLDNCPNNIYYIRCLKRKACKSVIGRLYSRINMECYGANPFSNWVRKGSLLGMELVESFRPDVIFSSSTPCASHLVALNLKKNFDIPWVASFSDPWPPKIMPKPYTHHAFPLLSAWQMLLLKKVLRKANAIHMPNAHAVRWMAEKTRIDLQKKAFIIPHIGSEVSADVPVDHTGWLVHVGDLSRERISKDLLVAIREVAEAYSDCFKGLLCVGPVAPGFTHLVKKLNMEQYIRCLGTLAPEKAMAIAKGAQAVLLIEANMKRSVFLPSKFADYVMCNCKIMAVTPKTGPVSDYVTKFGGAVLARHDRSDIAKKIRYIFVDGNSIQTGGTRIKNLFSEQAIARAYLKMFEEVKTHRISLDTLICVRANQV